VEEIKKRYDSGHSVNFDSVSDPFVVCDVLKLALRTLPTTYPGYLDQSLWQNVTKQVSGMNFKNSFNLRLITNIIF
jgi:hypothetical protein